jgi:hypothetical protein
MKAFSTLKRETKIVYNMNYEFIQKQFTQVERFRTIEFERDWNRPLGILLLNDQHLANAEVGIVKYSGTALLYNYNMFTEGTNYEGNRHQVTARVINKGFYSSYIGSLLNSTDQLSRQNTEF